MRIIIGEYYLTIQYSLVAVGLLILIAFLIREVDANYMSPTEYDDLMKNDYLSDAEKEKGYFFIEYNITSISINSDGEFDIYAVSKDGQHKVIKNAVDENALFSPVINIIYRGRSNPTMKVLKRKYNGLIIDPNGAWIQIILPVGFQINPN